MTQKNADLRQRRPLAEHLGRQCVAKYVPSRTRKIDPSAREAITEIWFAPRNPLRGALTRTKKWRSVQDGRPFSR